MKFLSLVALFLLLVNVIYCDQFFMMTKYNHFISFNTTTGEIIKQQNAGNENKYFFYAALAGNETDNTILFLAQDLEFSKDYIVQYDINNNSFTPIKYVESAYGGYEWPQLFAYDPAHNFAALPSLIMNQQKANLTIFVWDFNAQEIIPIELPTGELQQFTASDVPVGSYDPITGNYYILYILTEPKYTKGTTLIVYNMWSRKYVQEPIFFPKFQLYAPQVVYANGEIFFIETSAFVDYQIYKVDTETQTIKEVFTIANKFKDASNFGGTMGRVGNNIILLSSGTPNHYSCTTVDLFNLNTRTSPSYSTDTVFGYEWVSGAF